MSTSNLDLTTAWEKVAEAADDPVLLQLTTDLEWEVAAVATDTDPTVTGHLVRSTLQQVARSDLGAGYLFARMRRGTGVLVVSK